MSKLVSVKTQKDIPARYRNSPISKLILYHNQGGATQEEYKKAEIFILTCMDNSVNLKMPPDFSYVVRNSGARLNGISFSVSFAVSVGKIRHMVIIGHSDCQMVDLKSKKKEFEKGLSTACGWKGNKASKHYSKLSSNFNTEDSIDSVISETKFIRSQYPGIIIAPLFLSLDDNCLSFIKE